MTIIEIEAQIKELCDQILDRTEKRRVERHLRKKFLGKAEDESKLIELEI
jgi:hypothetical protein